MESSSIRATEIAQAQAGNASPLDVLAGKYMTFKLAKEEYGLQILYVREIIGLMGVTRVPRTQPFMKGVINLRGRVIPVIDLRLKFEMPETEPTDQTVIIVVQVAAGQGEMTMGVIVDEVLEVLDVPADQIEPPPAFGQEHVESDFILGVGKAARRVVFLLDINKVLTGREMEKLRAAAENN